MLHKYMKIELETCKALIWKG